MEEEDFEKVSQSIQKEIQKEIRKMQKMTEEELVEQRYEKFRSISGFRIK